MKNSIPLFLLLVACFFPWASARAEEPTHDCLVVVVDGSGSMSYGMEGENDRTTPRIDIAKPAIKAALATVPKDTWIGILVFSDAMRGDGWVIPLGPRDPDMNAKIDSIRVEGGTPLGEYIEKAEWALLQERERQYNNGRYRMLVVTDGAANDAALMEKTAPDVVERGIELTVIPLGTMNADHSLSKMANRFLPVASAAQLETALAAAVNVESGGNSQAISEDFAVVSGLPDDVAAAWIAEITAPKGNWRFGHKPEPPKPAADKTPQTPTSPRGSNDPQPPPGGCSTTGNGSVPLIGALMALVAASRRRRAA